MNLKLLKLNHLILKQRLEKSDVIVWLQGDRFDRGNKVIKLFKTGWAPRILITGNDLLIGSEKRDGENNISLLEMQNWLLKKGLKKKQILIERNSLNTKEQAQNTIKLAKKNRWNSLIIVGSSYCQPRSFLTFLKAAYELRWFGKIINQPAIIAEDGVPGGREKKAKKILAEEATKLEKYKAHTVSAEEGIRYLLLNKEKLFFRKANKKDAELLLRWRNDPIVRKFSFSQHKINLNEHRAWFKKILKNPRCHLYIILNLANEEIGTVRFDEKDDQAEINIVLAPEFRGRGYGNEVILLSSRSFLAAHPEVSKIVAQVKEENIASVRAFLKSGYKEVKKKNEVIILDFTF